MYPKGHIGSTLLVSSIAIHFFNELGLLFALVSTLYTLSPDIDQALNPIVDIEKISHSLVYVAIIPLGGSLFLYWVLSYVGAGSYVDIYVLSEVIFLAGLSGAIMHLLTDALTQVSSEITWPIHLRMSLRLTTPDNRLLNNTILVIGLVFFGYMVVFNLQFIEVIQEIVNSFDIMKFIEGLVGDVSIGEDLGKNLIDK